MVTQVTFQLPATGSTIAVDTQQKTLPVVVQSALGADVSHGAPYLHDGRVLVDFSSRTGTPRELTVLFAKQWRHLL